MFFCSIQIYSNHVLLTCWPFLIPFGPAWLIACLLAKKKHTHNMRRWTCRRPSGNCCATVQRFSFGIGNDWKSHSLEASRAELDRSVSVKNRLTNHALRWSSNKSRIVISKMSGHFGMKFDLIKPKIHKKLKWSYLDNIMTRWFKPWPIFVPDPWMSPTSPFQGSTNL